MLLLEQILNGLLVGTYYTLLALGLSIIFSLGGVVNLAHGAFYAVGAYLIVFLSELIGFPVAFVVTPILVGMIGIIVETFFLRRLYTKDPILTLLFTFGLAGFPSPKRNVKARLVAVVFSGWKTTPWLSIRIPTHTTAR